MSNTFAIRVAGWRDAQTLFALTIDEATALKNLGMRWHCRAISRIGDQAIGALAATNASADSWAIVQLTPRNIVTALAFAGAELAVTDEDSADFWPPKMRAALESLSRNMEIARKTMGF